MSIKELIAKLSEYENQDATVHIVYGNEDKDLFDRTDFTLFSDASGDGYIDIFVEEQ